VRDGCYRLCMAAQTTLIIHPFDRRAIELQCWRLHRGRVLVNNSAIARRLGVSQATVSRARAGKPVSAPFIDAAIRGLGLSYAVLFTTTHPHT